MTTWPDTSFSLLRLYIEEHKFDATHTSVLRRFQRYVMQEASDLRFSTKVLSEWLKEVARVSTIECAIDRAQRVTRFFDWLVKKRALESNPLRELRRQYCSRQSTAGVVRALVSKDPNAALAALRTAPPYGSHLGAAIRSHVERMQQLGCRYSEHRFLHFDRFLQQRVGAADCPAYRLVQEYAASAKTAATQLHRLQVGRVILDALRRNGEVIKLPKRDRCIVAAMMRERCKPYIFTQEDIQRLLTTALSFSSPNDLLRPSTLYTMLVLAYCAGLRLGEIVRLRVGDVRVDEGLIDVRDTKFFKSRSLPLTVSALEALKRYLHARMRSGASTSLDSSLFCNKKEGYKYVTTGWLLRKVLRKSGLKPKAGRLGPRIHDLRHTFVCHRMLAWYREGVNVQARLPYLWTYLGHRDLRSTIVYVTVTQELLQEASDRFRKLGAGLLHGHGGRA